MEEKKAEKILFVTYNGIDGFPEGLYEDEKIITLSGEYGGIGYLALYRKATTREEREFVRDLAGFNATMVMTDLDMNMDELLDRVFAAYVYCGVSGLDIAKNMIGRMKSKGIEARLVGCNCYEESKRNTANELGIEFIPSECGGYKTLKKIAEKYRNAE